MSEPLGTPPSSPKEHIVTSNQLGTLFVPFARMLQTTIGHTGSALQHAFYSIAFVFSSKPFEQNDVIQAISKLKATLEFIDDKLVHMREKVELCESEAMAACSLNDKATALHQIRLKSMYKRECNKINALRFNIESNILHMESVGVMMETVSTIKDTSTQFKIISKHVNISKLEDSIEEMFEQNEACSSIEDALSDLNNSVLVDDDDLKEELEKMMSDVSDRDQQPRLPVHFPPAPVFHPKVPDTNTTKVVVPA